MKTCPVVVEVVPEILEYKLEYTPDLRCEKQTDLVPVCHSCKSCILSWKAFSTREWFVRASRASQGQFLVGIIKRFKSQDLLKYAWNLLQATDTKDFTYSRSCVSSSLMASSTLDRALDPQKLEQSMADLWKWFLNASFWSKANYILLLLQMCDTQLLLMAASMIRIFLSQDEMVTSKMVEKDKGHLRSQRVWSKESDQLSGDSSEGVDSASGTSTALNVTKSSQKPPNINKFKDFIRCLPIHLSKYILRMLDLKSLNRCAKVSPHWNFLVKQIRKDIISNRSLRSEIAYLQGSCPKRAISNYAKIVKVTIPRINTEGNIISLIIKNKQLIRKESEHLHKAYHGQETNTVKLEERNVFCGGYNVRILIDSLDPNRVIHYSGGKLLAIGSVDRKVHLMDMNDLKRVPPILFGHAGSIRAIYLNEQKGLLLSGSYDLSIRMWNIFTGSCVKIFNGHSGSITCLDLYKNKFVSGSKDCTAKMWNIETGKCMKTFGHKAIVWAAKMNETHVVSACDKGLVKVWHAETCILIKTLQGHLGPVKCLSFDQWHLVTGSSDGYILGWSMLGNHKRCLGAFRHPMEVLSLGFLYLRVISGCADGKIRIFNFLTGTCLRVMRANSRGDPVVSFCMVDNKLVINAQSSVVLFQFEEVIWDHTQTSDRLIKTKEKCKFDDTPFRIQPSPHSLSQRKRRANKNNWKLYSTDTVLSYYITRQSIRCSKDTPGLCYEIVREPPPRTSPQMRKTVAALDIKPDDKHRLSSLAINQRHDESEHEPLAPASSKFGQNAEAFIKYIKKKLAHGPLSNDQLLLTVSTMQHAYQTDHVSANMAHNMKIKDAWGAVHLQKEQRQNILVPQNPEQQKMDPSTQLKRLKAARGILGMERISTPYEVKTLQLNLKNSLLGSSVKSFIPVPTITRSKSCNSLSGGKKKSGQAKMPPPTTTRGKVIGHYTTSSESIKVPRMKIAQPDTDIATRRGKLFFVHSPNPYRLNTGFQLLTTQQMKEYEEAKIHEYQAKKTKVIANREKESKNAWLRKIKGLPIDDFTKEGKVAAPELGDNVFI
ncbi:F-box and WD repeat domain containing protein 10B [Rhineura floridana]|uniref:F-box and WD repeat domain containing protein 10B n=1 Tax=Rhineura floridana TaxID=261503 RepID=UPI002AC858BB|nr:F-box and WD repeat domain containing protein 10B [Rhineura floridana]